MGLGVGERVAREEIRRLDELLVDLDELLATLRGELDDVERVRVGLAGVARVAGFEERVDGGLVLGEVGLVGEARLELLRALERRGLEVRGPRSADLFGRRALVRRGGGDTQRTFEYAGTVKSVITRSVRRSLSRMPFATSSSTTMLSMKPRSGNERPNIVSPASPRRSENVGECRVISVRRSQTGSNGYMR